MTAIRIQAIVEDGRLRLLSDVPLVEGQTLELVLFPEPLPEHDRIRALLGDLVTPIDPLPHADTQLMLDELDRLLKGQSPNVSEAIIEERRTGR